VTAIDISDRTYSGQIRKSPGSADVAATFTSAITNAAAGVLQLSFECSNSFKYCCWYILLMIFKRQMVVLF
jgi:hypothetical protein